VTLPTLTATRLDELAIDSEYRRLYGPWWDGAIKCDELLALVVAHRERDKLAQAYTAILTALEASDSDRQKLKARVAELEAKLAKAKTDRDWFQSMLARNASTQA
jgi:hypothetical protein